MKKCLKDSAENIVNESIIEIQKIQIFDTEIKSKLIEAIRLYTPLKERAFLIKTIGEEYNLDLNLLKHLYLGIEIVFVSYYIKDDIIDNAHSRYNKEIFINGIEKSLIISDILLEIGHSLILDYIKLLNKEIDVCLIYHSLQNLSLGQYVSLNCDFDNYPTIEDLFKICYFKSGALFESSIKMLKPLFFNKTDFEILVQYAKLFGIASQIRNDIEDFILEPHLEHQDILKDLINGQANFVLSVYNSQVNKNTTSYQKLKKYFKKNDENVIQIQDEVFKLLEDNENAISISILHLNNYKTTIYNLLSKLENIELKRKFLGLTEECFTMINT